MSDSRQATPTPGQPQPLDASTQPVHPQKLRTGFTRIAFAGGYSIAGLKAGWRETAFRQEAVLAMVVAPAAFWLGRSWVETVVLLATVVLVLVTELLNTAIESAIDRVGPEWHALSKRAKDLGSAAVLLSLLLCAGAWVSALVVRW